MIKKAEEKFSWLDMGKASLHLAGENKKWYIIWTIALIVILAYDLIPPLVLGLVVDFFTEYEKGQSLTPFYTYTIALGLSFSLVAYLRLEIKQALGRLRAATVYDIKVEGFKKLITQEYAQYSKESTGSKVQKIQSGAIAFESLTRLLNDKIFSAAILFVGVIGIFIFIAPTYAILFCIYAIVFFGSIKYFYSKIQRANYAKNIAMEESSGSYVEGLSNVLTVKASGAEKSFQEGITNKETVVKKHALENIKWSIRQWKFFQVFNGVFMLVFLLFIGLDVANGVLGVGAIVAYFTYLQRLTSKANQILSNYRNLIEIKVSISRMMPIFFGKSKNKKGDKNFPKKWSSLQFTKVNFEYQKEAERKHLKGVKNLKLSIKKHKKVGFVGKTGSGKSTLAKLLIGLYKIDSGEYLIGNRNFYNIKNEEIQDNISIILQESEMFNLSLKDNITLMQNFDEELFSKAVKISQLEEVVKKLPKGLDTIIGEKGYHLSGGEKQRVGIARAIYRDAQIIIFDEATSSLDNNTETLIQNAIESKLKKKTLIFIAHRITTLENVDKIYVFKDGRIVEQGKYQELLSNSESEFFRLAK